MSELDDVTSMVSSHFRVRRDDLEEKQDMKCHPHPFRPMKMCCAEEVVLGIFKENMEMKKECLKELNNSAELGPITRPLTPLDPLNCEDINKQKEQLKVSYLLEILTIS